MGMRGATKVRQSFRADRLSDVGDSVRCELTQCGVAIRPGARIAIAVGSRGIDGVDRIVREVVRWVRDRQAEPFIVPAMGSHGGATAEGQEKVLAGYGITEEGVGAPVRSSMAVVELPQGAAETKVFFDQEAIRADGTILVNRVKVHTSFRGSYESGLMKMMAIGLGKHAQAEAIHRLGVRGLREVMPQVARQVLSHANVLLGLAIVENAYDQVMLVRAIPAAEIPGQEPALLELARQNMPRLPVDRLDLLIVDEVGKNISGLGMDPNVIGRLKIRGQPEPDCPDIRFITVHDLTAGSHGNAIGMGLADVITRRFFEKIDFPATYANVLTTTFLERAKVPIIAETDRRAVEIALEACGLPDPAEARVLRIRNTLRLDELQVSPPVLENVRNHPDVTILGSSLELFDASGSLLPW
jgi:hypothetical protein